MFRYITDAEYENALLFTGQINEIIAHRARLLEQGRLKAEIDLPSKFWKIIDHYRYILNPSYDIINTLRFHTFPFTGNYIGDALPSYWRPAPEEILSEYEKLTAQLPDELIARPPRMLGEIGWEINGGIVNKDMLMYQKHIRALYLSRVVDLLKDRTPIKILEIGPGYGALAYYLWKMLSPSSYYMIDLPESLAFSTVYLGLATGKGGSLVYNGSSPELLNGRNGFVFAPNFLADDLAGRCKFDLIINTGSFGEMAPAQVAYYTSLMDTVLADNGIIYEENGDGPEYPIIETLSRKFKFLSINKDNKNMRLWATDGKTLSGINVFRNRRPRKLFFA